MGIVDRLFGKKIQKLATEKAEKASKEYAQKVNAAYAGYFGSVGRFGGTDSGGAKWPYGLSADGRSRILSHLALRQNARDAFHDSMDARAIVERYADSVVDTGIVLDSTPNAQILGITPEYAEEWGANVSNRFHLWAQDKKQHRAGLMTFYQAQRLYEIMQHRDNDMFVRLFYSNRKTLQSPLQYGFIDANQIRGYAWTSTYSQTNVEDGIERYNDGREKAYKVWLFDAQKKEYQYKTIPRVGEKSGRTMMLHGYNPEYAGQRRGYSRLGFAIQELENITDFASSVIKKAINQSNFVMAVENEVKDPSNPFEDIENSVESAIGASLSSTATEAIDNLSQGVTVCPLPEAGLDTPGSTAIVNLTEGDKVKMLENTAPADSFKDFVTVFAERLASAAGIPIEVVLMKFSNNYSASRATLLLFWRVVQIWREEMIADLLNPIYESWLGEEIAAGNISAPGWGDPVLKAAWLYCQWIGSPLPSIDPGKEANARKLNLEMNLTTIERESRNLNGSDAKMNVMKNKKTFPEMAVPYWQSGSIANNVEEKDEGDKENDEAQET